MIITSWEWSHIIRGSKITLDTRISFVALLMITRYSISKCILLSFLQNCCIINIDRFCRIAGYFLFFWWMRVWIWFIFIIFICGLIKFLLWLKCFVLYRCICCRATRCIIQWIINLISFYFFYVWNLNIWHCWLFTK